MVYAAFFPIIYGEVAAGSEASFITHRVHLFQLFNIGRDCFCRVTVTGGNAPERVAGVDRDRSEDLLAWAAVRCNHVVVNDNTAEGDKECLLQAHGGKGRKTSEDLRYLRNRG